MPEAAFSEGVQNRFIPISYLQLVKHYYYWEQELADR
jgi:hypothetical protein